jgi:N-glycosylase/DNA lyase
MWTGKSYLIMKYILATERLFPQLYHDLIIYTSTSNLMNKIVESLGKMSRLKSFSFPTQMFFYILRSLSNVNPNSIPLPNSFFMT